MLALPRLWLARRRLRGAARRNEKILRQDARAAEAYLTSLTTLKHHHPGIQYDREFAAAFFFSSNLALDLTAAVLLSTSFWNRRRRRFLWRTIAVTLYEGMTQLQDFALPALSLFLQRRLEAPDLLSAQKTFAKHLSRLEHDHAGYLCDIKDNSPAHKEPAYEDFVRSRASIDEARLTACLTEFFLVQTQAQKLFRAALRESQLKIRNRPSPR